MCDHCHSGIPGQSNYLLMCLFFIKYILRGYLAFHYFYHPVINLTKKVWEFENYNAKNYFSCMILVMSVDDFFA